MFQKANEINPNYLSAYWLSLNTFPVIYKNTKELGFYRNRFIENIKKLNQLVLKNKYYTKNEILKALTTSTNFYLHYQGKNDLVLQTQYANIENLKKVTNKSSVYGEISYDDKTKKTLLEIEELDNKETNKIIGKSINDIISIDLLKLTKNSTIHITNR